MEIAFHSLFRILTTWLLISSTFGDIALQPGFDQPSQFRHLSPNIQPNHYQPGFQPYQLYHQPYYGQFGQMPYNFQSMSSLSWPYPWMMNYRPYQSSGQPGILGPSPSFPTAPNQFQPRDLNAEFQRNRELQQKLSAHISGLSQSNSAQLPQQAMPSIYPSPSVPPYPFYPNNLRIYRSLPIFQSQGYQIIRLRDLQNAQQQGSWSNPVDSGLNSGLNQQTHNSQHHEMATNSTIDLSQLELTTPEFSKKVDDDIVGSPLQIYKSQSSLNEQHHPVEMVNIPDNLYISNNTKTHGNIEIMKTNPQNFSKIVSQINSQSSDENGNFSQDSSQKIEEEVSYVGYYTDKPTKDISEEVKSQSIHQHSTHKDYAISSKAKGNDRPITNIQYPFFNGRINYNQPQVFEVGVSPHSRYVPQMDSINLQTSKIPAESNYQSKAANDFYNSYKNYPSLNVLAPPTFPFTAYNLDNSYNTATNTVSKESAPWQSSGLSTTGYVPNRNNFGTNYYQS
ncbi:uncharacterized protein [Chelonus insularis]|uniref:uncharacterized protein n=1 Tax=Chelonus insularis TaxID=460826 RepID=UPI00158D8E46|nr:uncharacterized protein LOC118066631 [Chelonus insularis]